MAINFGREICGEEYRGLNDIDNHLYVATGNSLGLANWSICACPFTSL